MNHSTPGLPVHHQLLEFTQTHVHRVSDAIKPSHPLSSPSPPAANPSQHQSAEGGQITGRLRNMPQVTELLSWPGYEPTHLCLEPYSLEMPLAFS